MKGILILALLQFCAPRAGAATTPEEILHGFKDVLTIAVHPAQDAGPHFTAESLKIALPNFKQITPYRNRLDGYKPVCQTGVIVLKSKEVLFWTACYPNEIQVATKGVRKFSFGIPGKKTQ